MAGILMLIFFMSIFFPMIKNWFEDRNERKERKKKIQENNSTYVDRYLNRNDETFGLLIIIVGLFALGLIILFVSSL